MSSVAFYLSVTICWKKWHPLQLSAFMVFSLLQSTSLKWGLLVMPPSSFLRLQRHHFNSSKNTLKQLNSLPFAGIPMPLMTHSCCKTAVEGRESPTLSMQNAEDIEKRDGGITRLTACKRLTNLAAGFLKGLSSVCFSYPIPSSATSTPQSLRNLVCWAKTAEN